MVRIILQCLLKNNSILGVVIFIQPGISSGSCSPFTLLFYIEEHMSSLCSATSGASTCQIFKSGGLCCWNYRFLVHLECYSNICYIYILPTSDKCTQSFLKSIPFLTVILGWRIMKPFEISFKKIAFLKHFIAFLYFLLLTTCRQNASIAYAIYRSRLKIMSGIKPSTEEHLSVHLSDVGNIYI
jgi:hypothetical protein